MVELCHNQVFETGSTFQEVINKYRRYVSSKCKICQTVFDGYKLKTTKDHKYARRKAYNTPHADVLVNENVIAFHSREEFLSNSSNEQHLIKLLAKHFRGAGHTVIGCEGDTDTQIVAAALDISCFKQGVIVVAYDTDILVLLLYFWNSEMGDIILQSMSKSKENMVNIRNIFSHLNKTVVKNLQLTQEDISKAGIRLFTVMYGMASLFCFSIKIFNVFQDNVFAYSGKTM